MVEENVVLSQGRSKDKNRSEILGEVVKYSLAAFMSPISDHNSGLIETCGSITESIRKDWIKELNKAYPEHVNIHAVFV